MSHSRSRRIPALLLCLALTLSLLSTNMWAVSTIEADLRPDMHIVIDGTERAFYTGISPKI